MDEHALALTIILPLIGFCTLLAISPDAGQPPRRRGLRWSGGVGDGVCRDGFLRQRQTGVQRPLWTWMSVGNFNIGFNTVLDGLSLTMLSVVTGVGFLIHMFASRAHACWERVTPASSLYQPVYRQHGCSVVLSDNLLLILPRLGRRGLCSYLLIGFWLTLIRKR